jgi:Protein of unknown function (DUF3551)
MSKLLVGMLAAALLASLASFSSPVRAEVAYRWCAQYSGRHGGATNCGFVTLEQCRAAIGGIGGICYENPRYSGRVQRHRQP